MRRLIAILLFVIMTAQFAYVLPNISTSEKTKSEISSINLLDESNEVFSNDLRLFRPKTLISFKFNLKDDDSLNRFQKGNSLFFIHNQLLPKTLTSDKIRSSFFTTYFSTAI